MNKILFFLLLAGFIFGIEFLGDFGKTFEIKEENGLDAIKRNAKNITKEQIEEKAKENIAKSMISDLHLPFCKANKIIYIDLKKRLLESAKRENIHITNEDIKKIDLLFLNLKVDYAILDIQDPLQIAFAKTKSYQNALVLGGFILDSALDFIPHRYLYNKDMQEMLNVQCTPSYVIFNTETKKLEIQEIYLEGREK